jgi:hypothetical protein
MSNLLATAFDDPVDDNSNPPAAKNTVQFNRIARSTGFCRNILTASRTAEDPNRAILPRKLSRWWTEE